MRNIHDVFSEVGTEKSINKKAQILKENDTPGVRAILRGTFDRRLKWLVPDSKPPEDVFTVNEEKDWEKVKGKLENAATAFYFYVEFNGKLPDQAKSINQIKREQMFIQMLEALHEDEVDVVFSMLKRKLPYKGLTARVANKAFPGLIPEEFE